MDNDNVGNLFTTLCLIFAVLLVLGNLTYQKIVYFPLFSFHSFTLSVGTLLYPLSYFITDLIAELYGKKKAQFCVRLALATNLIVVCIIAGMDKLEATPWSFLDNAAFHHAFGNYSVAFFASLIACSISQTVDIKLYLWLKKITYGKWLGLRNLLSTACSLLVDTSIVISIMAFSGLFPIEVTKDLILNSFGFKLLLSICTVPFFYLVLFSIKKKPVLFPA